MLSEHRVYEILAQARENAEALARKNCESYIALNPGDEENRKKQLHIEFAGIASMYLRFLEIMYNK